MITQETALTIYKVYREIEAGKALLTDTKNELEREPTLSPTDPILKNSFVRRRYLELSIPSGKSSQRLMDVSPDLAQSIIIAHIANKEAELVRVMEQAKIELSRL